MLKPRSALLASVCLLPALVVLGVPVLAAAQGDQSGAAATQAPPPATVVAPLPVHHIAARPAHAHVAAAAPSGGIIQGIAVTGNHRIDAQTIASYMVAQPGQPFDPEAINQSLKTLYATGLFKTVSITRQGGELDVAVEENPLVNQVFFSGNKVLADKDATTTIALKARAVYTPAAAEADRRALLDAYAKKGYYDATVTPDIIFLPNNRVNVVYNVNDGTQTLISRINFIGNEHFGQGRLREVISTRQAAWYRFLSSSDQYDPDRIEYDEYLLHKFYLHEGYADFSIVSANAALGPDRKSFFLTFNVSEGARYHVSSVKVVSHIRTLTNAQLRGLVPLGNGDVFDGDALQEGIDAVNKRALNLGYAFAQVNPEVAPDPKTHEVAITLNVVEGPRVYIQRIDITGNTRTQDQVIRRELTVAEGDAYNQSRVDGSTKKIKDLGYFKDEKITSAAGTVPQQVVLDTAVTEQANGQFSLGGGYSTQLGALVNAGISQNNFLGTGTNASINALLAQRGTQINLGFTDPYFLDRDLVAGFDLFRSVTDSYTAAAESFSYSESDIGADVRLGYRFNDHVRQSFTYTISARDVYDIPTDSSVYIESESGGTTLSQISQSLTFDYVDDDVAPTSGLNVGLTTDFAGVGGTAKYVRVSPSIAYYIPLERVFGSKDWVLKFSASAGDLIPVFGYTDNIVDRFFLGGDNLRGFADGGVGVHDAATGDSIGGRVIVTQSTELHFPLPVSKDIGISGFAFIDAGTLYGATALPGYPIYDDTRPRVGAGLGISWNTPFGLINLSLAQPVVKHKDDQIQQFRVSFGTRF